MKILMPTTEFPPHPGGVASLAYEQAVGLAHVGHTVLVETVVSDPVTHPPEFPANVEVVYRLVRQRAIWRLLPLIWNLLKVVRIFRPDFVCCPTYRGFGLPLMLVAVLTGIRYSIYLHGTELNTEQRSALRRGIMKLVLSRATFVATNSINTLNMVRELVPGSASRLVAILPGVHAARFAGKELEEKATALRLARLRDFGKKAESRPEKTADAPSPGDPVILTAVCRMVRAKGIHLVLQAVSLLQTRRPDLDLYCVFAGGGPDLEDFKALSAELNLEGRTWFAGAIPYQSSAAFLKAADIYVQPSMPMGDFLESFGISFLEAQAAGLPCIGPRWGGVPEAVVEGQTSLLVEPGDVEALSKAIARLAENSSFRNEMASKAVLHAAGMTWSSHAARLSETILRQTIAGA